VQCRNRPSPSSGLIGFDMGCFAVILVIVGIGALIGFLSRLPGFLSRLTGETWWTIGVCAAALVLIGFVARAASTRAVRPPKGRLKVEATPQCYCASCMAGVPCSSAPPPLRPSPPAPFVAQRPPCPHLNAVPVDLPTGERVAWLCPACNEGLPLEFARLRRPCCGTLHGTQHYGTCPHFSEWMERRR